MLSRIHPLLFALILGLPACAPANPPLMLPLGNATPSPSTAPVVTPPSSAPVNKSVVGYVVVTADGHALTAVGGDAVKLKVMQKLSDGTTADLPAAAAVAWATPVLVTSVEDAASGTPLVQTPGSGPAGNFFSNTDRDPTGALKGVLFVTDTGPGTGTLPITATVSGDKPGGTVTATLAVSPMPAGDAVRGKVTYASNCSACHGATGHGTDTFPGLNAEAEHVAADPSWTGPQFTVACRSDVDNEGVTLKGPMPDWLTTPSATGTVLSTQDFADIFAWLKTQTN